MSEISTKELNKLLDDKICPDCGTRLQNNGSGCFICMSCGELFGGCSE